jgi:hypothetical protein
MKSLPLILAIATVAAILLGNLVFANAANASTFQQRQACANKYLPENTTKYDICIGGMGTPNINKSG